MKQILLPAFLIATLACLGAAAETITPSWPQFRGANACGTAADAKPPEKFGPQEGVLWSVDVPWSPSSPCVWGNRIFLTTFHEGQLETRCYDASNGKLIWSRGITPTNIEDYHRTDSSPAASTPVTDGHKVVSYFGSYGLVCHDMDGKELWRYTLPVALSMGQYGSGASPIIAEGKVIVNRDQYHLSSLLAVDLKTGKKVWETSRPESGGSFGTPVLWRNNGVDEIVVAAFGRLKGYDLKTGAERWVVEGVTGLVCTTPVIADGMLYFAAFSNGNPDSPLPTWEIFLKQYDKNGDGVVTFDEILPAALDYYRGLDANRDGKFTKEDWGLMKNAMPPCENVIVAVKPGGTGNITKTHVAWKSKKGLPYVASPLQYDGRIYFIKDGGMVTCLDEKTGEPFYTQERIGAESGYYASPVAADGRIYVASVPGKLTVLKAGGDKPEVLHQVDFGDRILATPALVGDKLYLRTEKKLWAFGK